MTLLSGFLRDQAALRRLADEEPACLMPTGSLPRPEKLARLMLAREQGEPVDATLLAETVRSTVDDIVKQQSAIGIDIISDGEMSKIGFANYVKDRLTGAHRWRLDSKITTHESRDFFGDSL